jgi:hypothetical protein
MPSTIPVDRADRVSLGESLARQAFGEAHGPAFLDSAQPDVLGTRDVGYPFSTPRDFLERDDMTAKTVIDYLDSVIASQHSPAPH